MKGKFDYEQSKSNSSGGGTVKEADDSKTVPFSNVTFFDKDEATLLRRLKPTRNNRGKI